MTVEEINHLMGFLEKVNLVTTRAQQAKLSGWQLIATGRGMKGGADEKAMGISRFVVYRCANRWVDSDGYVEEVHMGGRYLECELDGRVKVVEV